MTTYDTNLLIYLSQNERNSTKASKRRTNGTIPGHRSEDAEKPDWAASKTPISGETQENRQAGAVRSARFR